MKNLELLELIHKPLSKPFFAEQIFTETADATYFISNNCLYKHDFAGNSFTELCPLSFEGVTHLKVITFEKKICIVGRNSINIFDPEGEDEIKTLSFSNNIDAISWNSTEETVAIVFDNGDVKTYSIDYVNGKAFLQGESSFSATIPDTVYVGWGSKDTQFRGSEGKLKNQVPVEAKPVEDKKPFISWRENGELFVVNYWSDNKRMFVVFESPCRALYKSEECPGLQPLISWRPTGNMIATLAETTKQSIIIFEKNGQKRFSFDLDFGKATVQALKWSPCAQILTILTTDSETQTLHLLMCSNYKWYEKQTLTFKSANPLLNFEWLDTTQFTFTLKVVTTSAILKYVFRHALFNSSGVCAVVNGRTLQLTDFKEAVVPPVMFSKELTNSAPINFVSFDNNLLSIVDSENCLKVFDIGDLDTVISSVDLGVAVADVSKLPLACHHFVLKGSTVYFSAEVTSDTVIYNLNCPSGEVNFIDVPNDPVKHLLYIANSSAFGLKQLQGCLYMNDSNHNVIRQQVVVINNKTYNCHLTSNCRLHVNDHKVGDCVNSFMIFESYLLYTTKLNELCCLRLTKDYKTDTVHHRSIEQGATIVTAIKDSPKVVLQLPRGNLETISCRLISIDILDRLLSDCKWEEGLRFIRLEKLNANLLFDLDPKRFLGQVDLFIQGTTTVNELNSLCLEFEEGNVLKTMYKGPGEIECYPEKISAIFKAIFKYFDGVDYADHITTIMVINLNYFTLRDALVYLQDLLRRSYTDVPLKQKLLEAVSTLKTYGCDQNKLYTEALLLYDLDLAHFVATCCQLDPRIYEPHLNNLKNLDEVNRRYEINVFAKKPKSAVPYLLRCSNTDSDTVLTFIQGHNVHREAYETCPKNNRHFKVVSRALARSLSQQRSHQEAGFVFKRASLLEEALDEFILCQKWREALDIVHELKFDDSEKLKFANTLAEKLAQSRAFKEAAFLYEFHAHNYEMAIKVLLENFHFEEAIHIAKKHGRNDILQSEIVPLLTNHRTILEERLTLFSETFTKHSTRLATVRANKVKKFNNFGSDDEEVHDDLFSDAGSTITRSSRSSRSRSSTASSRNRRKEERKKQDLREGGIYEDIALIRALHDAIKGIYSSAEEVRTCCLLLLHEGNVPYSDVKEFYDFYSEIRTKVKNGVEQIWPPHFRSSNPVRSVQEQADLENFEHLDVEYRAPPSKPDPWQLNLF